MLPSTGVITSKFEFSVPLIVSGEVPVAATSRAWKARSSSSGIPVANGAPHMLTETVPAAWLTVETIFQPSVARSCPSVTPPLLRESNCGL